MMPPQLFTQLQAAHAKPKPKPLPFQRAQAKLKIGSLDDPELFILAQYNPKELQIKQPVPWTEHDNRVVEFTGTKCRTMSFELLFDGYEGHHSVAWILDDLSALASVRDPTAPDEALLRPHRCVVTWGVAGIPPLRCVIESVVVKYTMLDTHGKPLRAIATIELKEADVVETTHQAQARAKRAGRAGAPPHRAQYVDGGHVTRVK